MKFAFGGKKLHFVGVGGVSMSGLARFCAHYGAQVSGSDRDPDSLVALRQAGLQVYCGQDPLAAQKADLVIYTSAVAPSHPERMAAKQAMERSEFLGQIAQGFDKVVAVAGTHGKTTVCGFLCSILLAADIPFCAHIGGYVPAINGNVYWGDGDLFVTEACEYQRHFLTLSPTVGVITNVEYDHPDAFEDLGALQDAFAQFGSRCQNLLCEDGQVCSRVHRNTRIYAHPLVMKDRMHDNTLEMMFQGAYIQTKLGVWGEFNRQNAALAASCALLLGVAPSAIQKGLAAYQGAGRRQQLMGTWQGIPVLSDYAHHPTEIAALTQAARERYGSIAVVFQAHTYSRTKALLDAFATCFVCDTLFLLPTYAAREREDEGVDALLASVISVPDLIRCTPDTLLASIQQKTPHKKYGAILFVGAGDVHKLTQILLQKQ